MAWVYILECADGFFYVGSTVDLDARISQHNAGEGAAYTRRRGRRPVKLVWAADFARVDEAYAFEKMVQGWGRKSGGWGRDEPREDRASIAVERAFCRARPLSLVEEGALPSQTVAGWG